MSPSAAGWALPRALALAALAALSACTAGAAPGDGRQADQVADDGGGDAGAEAAACAVTPHLHSLEVDYFAASCTVSGACHLHAEPASGDLDLSAGRSRQQLVGVQAALKSAKAAGKVRVVAGHPELSFLYEKVTHTAFGKLMPYNATSPYDADCSVAALKKWIENGALDD